MTVTPISLGTQSNVQRHPAAGNAKLINCYIEDAGEDGKIRTPIFASDGFQLFCNLGVTSPIRQTLEYSDTVFYVACGTAIYKVTTLGTSTQCTGSISSSGHVTMAMNRASPNAQVGIVTSNGHYYVMVNDVVTEISLPAGAGTVIGITAMIGYFILAFSNGEYYVTALDDGTSIDDLDFAAAEANADGLNSPNVRGQDVVLFGPKTTEFHTIAINADFPFERAGSVNIGCWLQSSVCELVVLRESTMTDSIAFIGTNSDGAMIGVMLLDGYSAVKISDGDVDRAIRDEPTPSTIRAFKWAAGGHVFYCLVGSSFSKAYDTTTGRWHDRVSSGLNRWRVQTAASFAGKTIVGDYETGKLYWMKSGLYNASSDVVLTVRHSNDNGQSWIATRTKTISGSSNLKQRVKFTQLGQSKEDGKVFEITMTNAVIEDGVGVSMTVRPPAVQSFPNPMTFSALYIDAITGISQTSGAKGLTGLAVDVASAAG